MFTVPVYTMKLQQPLLDFCIEKFVKLIQNGGKWSGLPPVCNEMKNDKIGYVLLVQRQSKH